MFGPDHNISNLNETFKIIINFIVMDNFLNIYFFFKKESKNNKRFRLYMKAKRYFHCHYQPSLPLSLCPLCQAKFALCFVLNTPKIRRDGTMT